MWIITTWSSCFRGRLTSIHITHAQNMIPRLEYLNYSWLSCQTWWRCNGWQRKDSISHDVFCAFISTKEIYKLYNNVNTVSPTTLCCLQRCYTLLKHSPTGVTASCVFIGKLGRKSIQFNVYMGPQLLHYIKCQPWYGFYCIFCETSGMYHQITVTSSSNNTCYSVDIFVSIATP